MKVRDLIEELRKFSPDGLVLVSGYEGGYESGVTVSKKDVVKYVSDYFGDYDDYDALGAEYPGRTDAVVIERDSGARKE